MTRFDTAKQVGWNATGSVEAFYRAFNIGLDCAVSEVIRNGVYIGGYQDEPPWPGGTRAIATFSCELEGGPGATKAIVHNPLINACGFDVDVSSGVALWHLGDPHPTTGEYVAADIIVNQDGLANYIEEAVGNVVFTFEGGKFATMDFAFEGNVTATYNGATEAAIAALSAQGTPAMCQGYTLSVGPDGTTVAGLVCEKVTIDVGNVIGSRRDLNGDEGFGPPIIVKRDPRITFLMEAPAIATLNAENAWLDHTLWDFSFVHNTGGGANQVCTVTGSGRCAGFPKKVVSSGKIMYALELVNDPSVTLSMQWA